MAPFAIHASLQWRLGSIKPQADFEAASLKMNPPKVVFDNDSDDSATLITVDSANKYGCLLQVVQLLTDLDLVIAKARISSDGGWFVDVFHVTDQNGMKLTDAKMMSYIQQTLGAGKSTVALPEVRTCTGRTAWDIEPSRLKHAAIELSGKDRAGLLHEMALEILAEGCSIVAAEVWTHNQRVAFVIYVTEGSGESLCGTAKLSSMKEKLKAVMMASDGSIDVPTAKVTDGRAHSARRMHQLMFANRDFETRRNSDSNKNSTPGGIRPQITVRNSLDRGYTIINVTCADRPKLLFDSVCTLTDMQYVIHHATIESDDGLAMQEYFIRSVDGGVLESEAERDRLEKCMQAAIQRHTPSGTCLELCASDRVGLLAGVTGVFKEKGISIAAATVSTRNGKAINEFFVVDKDGGPVPRSVLEDIQRTVGSGALVIRNSPDSNPGSPAREEPAGSFSFSSLLRVQSERFLASLGLTSTAEPSSSLP